MQFWFAITVNWSICISIHFCWPYYQSDVQFSHQVTNHIGVTKRSCNFWFVHMIDTNWIHCFAVAQNFHLTKKLAFVCRMDEWETFRVCTYANWLKFYGVISVWKETTEDGHIVKFHNEFHNKYELLFHWYFRI